MPPTKNHYDNRKAPKAQHSVNRKDLCLPLLFTKERENLTLWCLANSTATLIRATAGSPPHREQLWAGRLPFQPGQG